MLNHDMKKYLIEDNLLSVNYYNALIYHLQFYKSKLEDIEDYEDLFAYEFVVDKYYQATYKLKKDKKGRKLLTEDFYVDYFVDVDNLYKIATSKDKSIEEKSKQLYEYRLNLYNLIIEEEDYDFYGISKDKED